LALCALYGLLLAQFIWITASRGETGGIENSLEVVSAPSQVVRDIVRETESRMERERDPIEKSFLSQLAGHYREPDARSHWISGKELNGAAQSLIEELRTADRFGLDPTDLVPPTLDTGTLPLASAEIDLSMAAIRYAWHARGGRFDPSQLSGWIEVEPRSLYVSEVFRAIQETGGDPVAGLRRFHPQHPQFEQLRQAYLKERAVAEAEGVRRKGDRAKLQTFLINLERWRTMPPELGNLYVWNNLPEFVMRLVEAGDVVHSERIIIGKRSTQTPVFSDTMTHLIVNPEWGVPESIKIRTLLPSLRRGDTGVLARRGMSIRDGDKIIDPKRYRWSKVDIRNVPIVQGAGPTNPLGQIKFMFPNHHDVYMHDTPDKALFHKSERAFSAGCIRVRNPDVLAQQILDRVQGWSVEQTQAELASQSTDRIDLQIPLPVHNTYFTAWADPNGDVLIYPDIYGHDARYRDALSGKPLAEIASRDPALALKKKNDELRKTAGYAPAAAKSSGASPLSFFELVGLSFATPETNKKTTARKVTKPKQSTQPPSALWFQ